MSTVQFSNLQKFLTSEGGLPLSKSEAIRAAGHAQRPDVVAALERMSEASYAARLGQVAPGTGKTGGLPVQPVGSQPFEASPYSPPPPGPLDLDSSEGRRAVAMARRGLTQRRGAAGGMEYEPLRATTDALGITHVRMNPVFQGRKVFGEQVVAHIDPAGRVTHSGSPQAFAAAPTGATVRGKTERVGPEMAQTLARGWFSSQMRPSSQLHVHGPHETVWVRDPRPGSAGMLRAAHHVQVHDFAATDPTGRTRAAAMNYLVDTETGDRLLEWNGVCGLHGQEHGVAGSQGPALRSRRAVAPSTSRVDVSASPGQIVAGTSEVSTGLAVDDPLQLRSVVLDLGTPDDPGVRHPWRGDVVVEVQSPSGTVATFSPHEENDDADNVHGSFDLSETFRGEASPGVWKVTLKDRYPAADDGQWRSVRLRLEGDPVQLEPVTVSTGAIDLAVPSGSSGVQSIQEIQADQGARVGRAFVQLDLNHPEPERLTARLSTPDGSQVDLGAPTGDRIPLTGALAGGSVAGPWTLSISDPTGGPGGILRSWSLDVMRQTSPAGAEDPSPPSAPVRGDDVSPFTGTVDVPTVRRSDGRYELTDPVRNVQTRDARNQDPNRVSGRFDRGVPFVSADDTWGLPEASAAELSGMETHYFAAMTHDFLRDVFGFDSLDGRGRAIRALANVGINFPNAFWFDDMFHVGTGDGRQSGRLSTADIVAHELAHGVTEYSAGLLYTGESGGLNEATSDILGTGLEWYLSNRVPDAPPFDWKIGEDTWTPGRPGDALRDMSSPRRDAVSLDHYADYRSGTPVHFSSGIANRFFHLLVEGGTHRRGGEVEGLRSVFGGNFDAAMQAGLQIWFRALQFYMTPTTDFRGAREATLRAARDLFPQSPEVQRNVASAWDAVGVQARRATRHAGAVA